MVTVLLVVFLQSAGETQKADGKWQPHHHLPILVFSVKYRSSKMRWIGRNCWESCILNRANVGRLSIPFVLLPIPMKRRQESWDFLKAVLREFYLDTWSIPGLSRLRSAKNSRRPPGQGGRRVWGYFCENILARPTPSDTLLRCPLTVGIVASDQREEIFEKDLWVFHAAQAQDVTVDPPVG